MHVYTTGRHASSPRMYPRPARTHAQATPDGCTLQSPGTRGISMSHTHIPSTNWLTRLITIQHPDPHVRRRGRSLAIIVLTMIGLSFLLIPLVFVGGMQLSGVLMVGVSLLIYSLALFLAHRGQVTLGGWIAALCVTIGVAGSTFGEATMAPAVAYSGLVFLAFSILIVSQVMPSAHIWWALLVNL